MSNAKRVPSSTSSHSKSVAVIGCGPTALYFLKHVVDNPSRGLAITFFSASETLGAGMPYNAAWVGEDTLANIACEEIPDLEMAPDEWFRNQSDDWLHEHRLNQHLIGPGFIPSRHLLGQYFEKQFDTLLSSASNMGISIRCLRQVTVTDIVPAEAGMTIVFRQAEAENWLKFDYVVMATGHTWSADDISKPRYLTSPWPIEKLEKTEGQKIGLIGTSLSAVDACLTLARKNGIFTRDFDGRLQYLLSDDAPNFRIVMHSRRGLLPPVRVHFEYPRFELYSYISKSDIQMHIKENGGNLSLDFLFERVLKVVMKEKSPELYALIAAMDFETFVEFIQERRKSKEPFTYLREEYEVSVASIREKTPIFWKEVLDDMSYTLNFHIRYLKPADVLRVHKQLMPLLTYLVAVLPQQSCEQILALSEANCLSVIRIGDDLTITDGVDEAEARIVFSDVQTGQRVSLAYDIVVDCRGQKSIDLDDFPFRTLVETGIVTAAKIPAETPATNGISEDKIGIGGISVDDLFHPISSAGTSTKSMFILAAPALHGMYPYHSGLPFCSEVAKFAANEIKREMDGRPERLPLLQAVG